MDKKLIAGLILLVIVLLSGIYLSFMPISSNGPGIELANDKIISDPQIVDLITSKMVSPAGNNLTRMVTDPDDPNIMDDPWEFAYHVCSSNEHAGWIYRYAGGDNAKPVLYGPYEWCLI